METARIEAVRTSNVEAVPTEAVSTVTKETPTGAALTEAMQTGVTRIQSTNPLKRAVRKEALLRRDRLAESERVQKSARIGEQLSMHPWYREAAFLLVYASYKSEVSTQKIICQALMDGKKVCCPVVTGKHEMVFCLLEGHLAGEIMRMGLAAMTKGGLGIPEPDEGVCPHYVYAPEKSLMLMPGCAFDDHGNRIGYGGGYYDRYLSEHPMRTIALFFECQHSDVGIEAEPHDVRPDLILTENGFRAVTQMRIK